ncbi:MAG: hypothetical protein P8186_02885 [Anaerolineae bacterium]|jgi:hypothetical protein
MTNRRNVPKAVETEVLIRCARRCCICYGLNGDSEEKKGQVAHLDRDPSNNNIDNLVYLCLDHHDQYDSKTSQSKGLTTGEVGEYRAQLYEAVALMRKKLDLRETSSLLGTDNGDKSSQKLFPIQTLSSTDKQVLQSILYSDDLAGASKRMLVELLRESEAAINSSLEKLKQLGLIYTTGYSNSGEAFYDLDRFRTETIVADRYLVDDEPPVTRYLRIDCITGYYQDEVSRLILEGRGMQKIVVRLRDTEYLLEHLRYAISLLHRSEANRTGK